MKITRHSDKLNEGDFHDFWLICEKNMFITELQFGLKQKRSTQNVLLELESKKKEAPNTEIFISSKHSI